MENNDDEDASVGNDEIDPDMPDDWDPGELWNEFPRDVGCHYFQIDRTDDIGKVLKTTQSFIPAGTLLWEEPSLFQNFKDWPRKKNDDGQLETKKAFKVRIIEEIWNVFSDEDKQLFTNFHWYTRGERGIIEFISNDMASRIDANAGPDNARRGKMVAYRHLNFVSHSCRPNCRIIDYGYTKNPRWALRTMVPIDNVGTVLTIDYDENTYTPSQRINDNSVAYLIATVDERREQIKKHYHFQCTCEACEDPNATNPARKNILSLHKKMMKEDLPDDDDSESWVRMAEKFDEHVATYIKLCEDHHLFPMILEAHKRAAKVYRKAGRKAVDRREISRADTVREAAHIFGQIETRRLLYGLWDPELQRLMKAINPEDRGRKTPQIRKK